VPIHIDTPPPASAHPLLVNQGIRYVEGGELSTCLRVVALFHRLTGLVILRGMEDSDSGAPGALDRGHLG